MRINFYNRGQSLIGIIIVLVTVGLITSGLYYCLQRQIPGRSEITGPVEEVKRPEEIPPLPEGELSPEELPEEEVVSKEQIEEKLSKTPEVTEPEVTEPEVTCQNECSPAGIKKCSNNSYQICGDYDEDSCLEWSSVVNCPANTVCQNGSCVQQKCSDGTPYNQCSTNQPKYCDNGNLIDKCETCGCPNGKKCHFWFFDYYCLAAECSSDQDCNDGKEKTIDTCTLNYEEKDEQGRPKFTCSHQLALRGNLKIAIVEFEAQGTNYDPEFLEKVNNQTTKKYFLTKEYDPFLKEEVDEYFYSFYYLEDFFEQEARRYGETVSVLVDVLGPFSLVETPPKRKGTDPCEDTLGSFFKEKREKYNLNLSNYDVVNYVYFSNGEDAFYSCSGWGFGKNNYIAIGDVEKGLTFHYRDLKSLAHETAHTFNATDKYGGFACSYPEGYANPNKEPLYPQSKACLMCGQIPIGEKSSENIRDFSDLIICEKTAQEIGLR